MEQERLLRRARRVVVAVSGGPDSVACLLLLRELGERLGFALVVAHFDHQLRPGSANETEFVRGICDRLSVACLTGEGDVAAMARERRMGVEAAAREMRYQFLAFVAGKEGADCLATGHTADDQVETVLMRITRGSGVRGVRGMLPSAPIPGSPSQQLVRPLLALRREDTVAICEEAAVDVLHDPSNLSLLHLRNRVRREVLPALRAVNPSVDASLLGLAESAREVFAALERQAADIRPAVRDADGSVFEVGAFASLPAEAITLVVERETMFHGLAFEVNRTRVENLRQVLHGRAGRVRFGDAEVEVSCGRVRIGPVAQPAEAWQPRILDIPGVTLAGPWLVQVTTTQSPAVPGTLHTTVSLEAGPGALRARPLVPGDRISWKGVLRKVSDVLANEKIPAWERRRMFAIAGVSQVLAIPGIEAPGPTGEMLYVRAEPRRPV